MSTAFIIYVAHYRPFLFKIHNRTELFNEAINMVISYHYILFTDFLDNVEMKFNIGWSIIGCISILILTNMSLII